MPSSRLSRLAASLNRASADNHGFSSWSTEWPTAAFILFSSRLHYPPGLDNKSMRQDPSRREIIAAIGFGWLWPPNWFHRHVRLAEAKFREIRHGEDRRRYLWIHGDERTAHHVLCEHI